ncbi:MAG: dTDP-4-dehydrorhamnose reductase [Hyphomonadaceae bacterium]
MVLRIATIGRNGQVARALSAAADGQTGILLEQGDSREADLRDRDSLIRFLERAAPDVLINAGAYNFVDRAEAEREAAFAVNETGPRVLAALCAERGIPFVHMSTDCVFDGTAPDAYLEDDAPNPLSVYGHSKLAGERAVADANPAALIVRVCWVFSGYAENFVSKMISMARDRPVLRVVNDQVGPPTYAPDIAQALLRIAGARGAVSGLLHLASPDEMDRAAMARAIMTESARQGGPFAQVEGVPSAEFSAPALRPLNARLSGVRATQMFALRWTPWPEALEQSVAMVLARDAA